MSRPRSWSEISQQIYRWVRREHGDAPIRVVIHTPRGEVSLPVHAPPLRRRRRGAAAPQVGREAPRARRQWHSDDWRAVEWNHRRYELTGKQAAVVRVLWERLEAGEPEVPEGELLNAADSDSCRLSDLFRRGPAWGELVVKVRAGVYRLAPLPPADEVA